MLCGIPSEARSHSISACGTATLLRSLFFPGSAGLFERVITGRKRLTYCRDTIRELAHLVFHDPRNVTDALVEDVYDILADRQYRRFLLKVSEATWDRHTLEELRGIETPTLLVGGAK